MVLRHEGSFESHLQVFSSRNCSLPHIFILDVLLPLSGVGTAKPTPQSVDGGDQSNWSFNLSRFWDQGDQCRGPLLRNHCLLLNLLKNTDEVSHGLKGKGLEEI